MAYFEPEIVSSKWKNIDISVDLITIRKYHEASSLYFAIAKKNGLKPEEYVVQVSIKHLSSNPGAYDDFKELEQLAGQHFHNMLFLTHSLIHFEWENYQLDNLNEEDVRKVGSNIKLPLNLAETVKDLVTELMHLNTIKTQRTDKISIQLNHSSVDIKTKKCSSIYINNSEAVIAFIEAVIEEKFIHLKTNYGFYLRMFSPTISTPSAEALELLYNQLPNVGFAPSNAIHLFKNQVVNKLLNYLNGENVVTGLPQKLNKKQGQIIYYMLSLFNIVEERHELTHSTGYLKAKYIRCILEAPETNSRSVKFPELKIQPE
jgi:hypothetical protein